MPASDTGILYVVATPIGNLGDLSPRVGQTLAAVDLVASEDTRHTRQLLAHLGIDKPLESYHKHSEREKAETILNALQAGKSVALVSDAGVPVVSDPGAYLVARAWELGIRVVPIPGPSAVLSALAVSGFSGDDFVFAGYPPRKTGARRDFYAQMRSRPSPTVLFEAPHRIAESLRDAAAALGDERLIVVARELTKLYEEVLRGTVGELCRHWETTEPLGEFTIVVSPTEESTAPQAVSNGSALKAAGLLASSGLRTKQAAEILAAATGLSRNEAYEMVLAAGADQAKE